MTDFERLQSRVRGHIGTKEEVLKYFTPDTILAADAAYEVCADGLTDIFIDDDVETDAEAVNTQNMAAVAAAVRFYADLLDIMAQYDPADLMRLFEEGFEND